MLRTLLAYALPPLLSILAAIGAGQVQLFPAGSLWNAVAVAVAAAIGGAIGLRIHPNGINGPAKSDVFRNLGFVRLRLVLVLLVLTLGATAARAQSRLGGADRAPPFGGCNAEGTVCAGPTAAVTLVGIDLRSGTIVTGIMPGAGYQVTFMADRWHSLGIGGYASLQSGAGDVPTVGLLSVVSSFAQYLRLGVGWQAIGGTHRWLGLFGLGMDFGP